MTRIEKVLNGLIPDTSYRFKLGTPMNLLDRMKYYCTPSVSIAVVDNHKIEWAEAFGFKRWGEPEPVDTSTKYQAGSISKGITSFAVMRMVQQGLLDIDKDVNEYLSSEWKVPSIGSWAPKVTIRHILSHTAGLTLSGFPGYSVNEPLPGIEEVLRGVPPSITPPIQVNKIPGIHFDYSGGGFVVLQKILEDVLEESFEEIMKKWVFHPLELENSSFEQMPVYRSNLAHGHPFKYRTIDGYWHRYPELAAAGLWSTPSDIATVGLHIQQSLAGDNQHILSQELARQMVTPYCEEVMGLGFFLAGKDSERFCHDGWDEEYISRMTM